LKVPATVKLDESLWKKIKKLAIDRGCTTSQFVEESLLASLGSDARKRESEK